MNKKKEVKEVKYKNLKEFAKYEKEYNKEDVVLFNSYCLNSDDEVEREKGIMSNLYSGCSIPYCGYVFHSSEQLLFFVNFVKWGEMACKKSGEKYKDIPSLVNTIDFLMHLKDGKQVKNQPKTKFFFDNIDSWKKREFGREKACFDGWKNLYFVIKMKYKYCKEFRDVLEKYNNKIYCENSHWGDNFCGVLWCDDIGKYKGINALGRVMKRVYLERKEIMKDVSI